uniref:Dynein light chain n=2 Tax=Ditylenchus dipsaci TaxID=166011 RepID=A0A915ETM1_9BILA
MYLKSCDYKVIEAEIFLSTVEDRTLQAICDLAWMALQKFSQPTDMAAFLKENCDQSFGASWQCIVGKTFGSFVSVDCANMLNFRIGKTVFLLYKTYSEDEFQVIKSSVRSIKI